MAEPLPPIGFWSYTRDDDVASRGRLVQFWQALSDELQVHILGPHRVHIFRDFSDIPLGSTWEQELNAALDRSSFLIPIVTPRFLQSKWCREELRRFRQRETDALKRNDLIFPVLYIDTTHVTRGWPDHDDGAELAAVLQAHQAIDFTGLRFDDPHTKPVAETIARLAKQIQTALSREVAAGRRTNDPTPPSPPPSTPVRRTTSREQASNAPRAAESRRTGGSNASLPPDPIPAATTQPSRLTPLTRWRDRIPGLPGDTCPEMITLPEGTFVMGAPKSEAASRDNERPQRQVSVPRFALGRYAVTFAQWDAAREAGAPLLVPDDQGWGRGDRPVINVSWNDANAYCAWLNDRLGLTKETGYRLPSEAEWEYACRAGTTTPFSFGATISTDQVNYDGNFTYGAGRKGAYRERTVPVGSLPANPWGLHEMHGNVWERCEDWYGPYPDYATDAAPLRHPDGKWRVLRGGCWYSNPRDARSAYRHWNYLDGNRSSWAGFRVARTPGR